MKMTIQVGAWLLYTAIEAWISPQDTSHVLPTPIRNIWMSMEDTNSTIY